ncbi:MULTISPECIES: bifunctional riboflavin kinase/FAD synthetase [Myroides]|uniref:Riboflavin biosynthesis protein n=1 Tax=Myroides odoratimimus CIP 101113 TaxID=883154 RepID=A0AAV3F7B4_9FLAO|nr:MULTISPECIES: bifunctional riboflavin kinase/FAD synthetase [Myroides]EHO15173.1 riboflavin biosynthesis protein RibF [Myroides odoratimimus CIP 101113]MCO7721637.1 bifunctional riboflavin kinase/FAD synthetase [Myroides odoratimimus]SHK97212.1 riboflavin kinase / FMN adenylyltransferase [Myroides odoratimimus subsp. xuanwuensis]
MKTFSSIADFNCDKKVVATLGTFDGVHVGHQMIIKKLVDSAKANGGESLVLTFFPHPRMVLKQDNSIRLLNTIEEKKELLKGLGLDNLVIQKFDLEFAQLSAEEFVKQVLVDKFNISKIIIGYDHRFGKNRTADIHDLKAFGEKYGFEVEEISAQEIDHVSISSTKIRVALEEDGNMMLANEFLGYEYYFSGTVVHGKKLGRKLGFPTANIVVDEDYKLIPENGVYVVESELNGVKVMGMMSVGINPTFADHPYTIEVNYLDWDGDLYDQKLKVRILDRIRDELKFSGLDELIAKLKDDERVTREFFSRYEGKTVPSDR